MDAVSKRARATDKIYKAVIERDDDGYWFVDFPDIQGCHTQGRTLKAARARMRDVLSLYVDDAGSARIDEHLVLAEDLDKAVARSVELRDVAEISKREALDATQDAAHGLAKAGLSLRDAGEALGLSFQRVQQLVTGQRSQQPPTAD